MGRGGTQGPLSHVLRSCAIIVENGRVLLQRDKAQPFWALPGERMEAGEFSAGTLTRDPGGAWPRSRKWCPRGGRREPIPPCRQDRSGNRRLFHGANSRRGGPSRRACRAGGPPHLSMVRQ